MSCSMYHYDPRTELNPTVLFSNSKSYNLTKILVISNKNITCCHTICTQLLKNVCCVSKVNRWLPSS